jgi:hypothetical protein
LIAVGENLERLPQTVQAVRDDAIGFPHLKTMARRPTSSGAVSTRSSCCPRRRTTRRASSITSATTTGTRSTPRLTRPSRPSGWRTASSASPPAMTERS